MPTLRKVFELDLETHPPRREGVGSGRSNRSDRGSVTASALHSGKIVQTSNGSRELSRQNEESRLRVEGDNTADDSTLSGTILESAVEEMRRFESSSQYPKTQKSHEEECSAEIANNDDMANNANESTLSGSLLETAMEESRRPKTDGEDLKSQDDSPVTTAEGDFCSNRTKHSATQAESNRGSGLSRSRPLSQEERPLIERTNASSSADFESKKHHSIRESGSMQRNLMKERHPGPVDRKMGPNQERYNNKYRAFVESRINDFRRRYPGELRDYRTMDDAGKRREAERVVELMKRLGIGSYGRNCTDGGDEAHDDSRNNVEPAIASESAKNNMGGGSFDRRMPAIEDDSFAANVEDADDDGSIESRALLSQGDKADSTSEASMALLSPIEQQEGDGNWKSPSSETSVGLLSPAAKKGQAECPPEGSRASSTQSIELARSCRPGYYESPKTPLVLDSSNQKKRLAATSGKRGSERARLRKDGSDNGAVALPPMIDGSPSCILETSIRRLSLGEDDRAFSLLQSPISPHGSNSSMGSDCDNDDDKKKKMLPRKRFGLVPDISFGEEDDGAPFNDSLDDTMMQERRVRWNIDRKELREIPADLRLKKGATLHYKPLRTEPLLNSHKASFPDPLASYEGRLGRRLVRLHEWLRRRDEETSSDGVREGIILSLDESQVINIALKLLLESQRSPLDPMLTLSQSNGASCDGGNIPGGTLIVCRLKEDIEEWGRALREGSPLGVLNHATLPLKERKTQSSARKCARYNVVLTTYDALKSPDVTVALDSDGHVLTKNVGVADDGWYSSRSGSQAPEIQQCKQLSVLHRICWQRVIFVDIVGRKCFLAKPDTLRTHAACALHAESRFVFFIPPEGMEVSSLNALVKSDKRALISVASVLRLEDDISEEAIIRKTVVDLNHLKKKKKKSHKDDDTCRQHR